MNEKRYKFLNGLHILLVPVPNSNVVRVEVITQEEYDQLLSGAVDYIYLY